MNNKTQPRLAEAPRWIVMVPNQLHGLFYGYASPYEALAYIQHINGRWWVTARTNLQDYDWLGHIYICRTWQAARARANRKYAP